jgi:dihydrofolate reductase
MGKLVVSEFITLDGVFEDPGGSEGTSVGGWQRPLMGDDEGAYKMEELKTAGSLVLGRVTYEGFAKYWPTAKETGEFGEIMNSLPKYVATLTASDFTWDNSQALATDVVAAIRKLKDEQEKDLLIYGSGSLVRSLLAENMVDELRLMTYPIVLNEGRRLFDGVAQRKLRFVSERTFQNGTVLLTYSQTV